MAGLLKGTLIKSYDRFSASDLSQWAMSLGLLPNSSKVKVDLSDNSGAITSTSRNASAYYVGPTGTMLLASANTPRFDYDPISLLSRGLLIEPAATNLLPSSTDIAGTSWVFTGANAKVNGLGDPFGGLTATQFAANGGTGQSHFVQGPNMAFATNTLYIMSCYVKNITTSNKRVQLTGAGGIFGSNQYANFSLDGTGTVLALGSTTLSAGIQALFNGWFRIWIVAKSTAASASAAGLNLAAIIADNDGRIPSNGATVGFLITGGQVEVAATSQSNPSSFIATTTAAVARPADNVVVSGFPSGVHKLRFVFDNASAQIVSTTITNGSVQIPTNLRRRRIKSIEYFSAEVLQGDAWIGQSNSVQSGANPLGPVFSTSLYPTTVLQFNGSRFGNGDPTQGGGLVNINTLTATAPLLDSAGAAAWPMTDAAHLVQLRADRLGETKQRILNRADSLGGLGLTSFIKGAEVLAAPKYFYENARTTRKAMKQQADALGLGLEYHISFIQGEDPNVPTDTYQSMLSNNVIDAHYNDSVTDIGKAPHSFVISQTNGLSSGANDQRPAPLAHIAETRRRKYLNATVALCGPMYQFPFSSDDIHLSDVGKMMHAELINRAQGDILANGKFSPLDIARTANAMLAVNQTIRAPGITGPTTITALGNGTGGIGTYTVSPAQSVPTRIMTAFGAVFEGSIEGNVLSVTRILDGALAINITGTTLTVRMNRSIRIDTDWVPTVGTAYGFEFTGTDGTNAITISAVSVFNDTVTITLSAAPVGAKSVGYAISNCGSSFYRTGGATNTNWAAPRGLIYHDTGLVSDAFVSQGCGWATQRDYLVRFKEDF